MKRGIKILVIPILLIFPLILVSSTYAIGYYDIDSEYQLPIQTRGNTNNSDWVINNSTSISDQTILLNGNLTVASTGNLTLRNINLKLNCTENGTYQIRVESGGTLLIENSNITTKDPKFKSNWEVEPDTDFKLINTKVSNFGWNENYLGLAIRTDYSIIENCTFTNSHVGVGFIDSEYGEIINCKLENNFYGIYLERSEYNVVRDCDISEGISGIVLVNSSRNNIQNCDVHSHKDPGIFLFESDNNYIVDCTIWDHKYSYYDFKAKGIFLKYSSSNAIIGSKIMDNANGIYIESSLDISVYNCKLIDNIDSGLNIYFSGYSGIYNSTFENNTHGITLWSGSNCLIENCRLVNNKKAGVHFMNSNDNIFITCKIDKNRDGAFFNGISKDNNFVSCTFTNSSKYDFNFTHEANVNIYETSFNSNKIVLTPNSNITVHWDLHIQVNNSTGHPASNASIIIKNYLNELVINTTTDMDGFNSIINLKEYLATLDNTTYFSPYTITAEKDGLINITVVNLSNTKHINLTLEPPIEPEPEDEDKDDEEDELFNDVCICLTVGMITFLGVLLAINYIARRRHVNKKLTDLEADMDKPPPGKVKCSECGALVLEEATACPRCGETFEGDEFECPDCGTLVPDDSDICLKCGKIFVASTATKEDEVKKKKDGGKFYCSDCGAVVSDKDDFCPACGEIFEGEKKDASKKLKPQKKLKKGKAVEQEFMCSMCGAQVSGGASRCPKCKTEFD
jgi:parallel beta-helix repeat protein